MTLKVNCLISLVLFLIYTQNIRKINCSYPNQVVDSNAYDKEKNVYKFEFVITNGMTMAVQNKEKGTFDPVVYNIKEQAFYRRDSDLDTVCNKTEKVTNQSDIDSIVGATGIYKPVLLINGMFPGPPIVVPKDAQVEITIHNKLFADIVNIHWHGQVQKGSFFMDGVPHVTECPITPGESYTYKFKASTVGTHWYHAHTGLQRSDGLYGPFIVKETVKKNYLGYYKHYSAEKSETKYDKEFYLILQDWDGHDGEFVYTTIHWRNFKFFKGYSNANTCFKHNRMIDGTFLPPVPFDTILINGKGWFNLPKNLDELSKFSDVNNLPIEEFKVEPNKRYLFRVISASGGHPYEISISGHKFTLVGTDGNRIKPIQNVDTLIIHSGERYDFELNTKSDSDDSNYFIFVKTLEYYLPDFSKFNDQHYGLALLKYNNAKSTSSNSLEYFRKCSKEEPCRIANCFHSFPKKDVECISADKFESFEQDIQLSDSRLFKSEFDKSEFQEKFLNFHFSGSVMQRASTNNFRFSSPKLPPYFLNKSDDSIQQCSPDCAGDKLCQCTHMLKLKTKKIVQLVFLSMGVGSTTSNTPHPIHLHGHHFYVMKMGFPTYDSNGIMNGNNQDVLCTDTDTFCNNPDWSNSFWKDGNVQNMSKLPSKKDTIFIPMGGYVVLRFVTDNIGYWFLHCHIENHMAEGMTVLIQEGSDDEIRNTVNWKDIHTCGKGFDLPPSVKSGTMVFKYNLTSFILILFGLFF